MQQQAGSDNQFKFLFIQQLLPLLRSESRKTEQEANQPQSNALVYDMPRISLDFNAPSDEPLFSLESDQLEKKIDTLYKDYQRQKQAYRRAMQIYENSKQPE